MPTLAFAASITLAVGVGLQWQAHQPVPDAAMDVAPAPHRMHITQRQILANRHFRWHS